MPIIYKIITAVLAVTGCVSLIITGEMNPLMTISGIAILPGYYRFLRGGRHAPRWAIATLSGATLFVFLIDSAVVSGEIFLAVAHLTVAFQAIKSFDLKEPWDHLQVYFMTLLQLIIASELTLSLAFGVVFTVFILMLVSAMILSHFLKEGALGKVRIKGPVILISALTLMVTAVFFIAIPRTPKKFFGRSFAKNIKTSGFSEKVDFGSFGEMKMDPAIVMRIEIGGDAGSPYYWRGITMDHFDGYSWKNSLKERHRLQFISDEFVVSPYDRRKTVVQKIYMDPIGSDIIFGLARITSVSVDAPSMTADTATDIYMPRRSSRAISYTVHSDTGRNYTDAADERYLQLPEVTKGVRDLAKFITSGARTGIQKAYLIEQYLRKNYTYSLITSPPPEGVTPVEDFLLNTKKGYCEHYAASMVVMLRELGIHSRIVNGFYGGEKNEYGGYIIVRQSDAHSWVEAYIDGSWERFDPTPSVVLRHPGLFLLLVDSIKLYWSRYIIGYSFNDQKKIIREAPLPFRLSLLSFQKFVGIKFAAILIVTVIIFSLLLYKALLILRPGKYSFITDNYLRFRMMMRKSGIRLTPSMTASDLRRYAIGHERCEEIAEFIEFYEAHRFGRKKICPGDRKKYHMLLKKIGSGKTELNIFR
ncbi:MAG: DUF3488 and transglutaminase-like domain-containing protein [Nitrospirota bacterium]